MSKAKRTRQNKKTITMLAVIAVILVIAVGGIIAYLTDTEQANNEFTIGKVDITLNEEDWDEADGEYIVANQQIDKNPTVKNEGSNPAWVYVTVTIPKAKLTASDAETSPLFTLIYEPDTGSATETNTTDWEEIVADKQDNTNEVIRVFRYNTALADGDETPELFTKVQVANIQTDAGLAELEKTVEVNAYAIQTEGLTIETGWSTLKTKYSPLN